MIKIDELEDARRMDINNDKESGNFLPYQAQLENVLNIKVKKTGLYYGLNTKVPTYNTQSPNNRGMLLLINNINFKMGGKAENEDNVDHENIKELFTQLGFIVVEAINKTKSEMEEIVVSLTTNRDLEKYDMCATIVMSHGETKDGQTMIETIDGENLSTKWIVEQFYEDKCEGMIDKPKIFIFRCCRKSFTDGIHSDAYLFKRKIKDILICYCTIADCSSCRVITSSSWYINDLCQVFMENAHDTDIESLLKMVDQKLSVRNDGNYWETSCFRSIGFKVCYLNPC
ncbi:caspase Dronc-like isoform X2 [Onthophagus taurus]|uniref:caspase Dronc-like isoform X2 n=1 Tax=Onthophagus taurus TaxID=166361 RepID=UPI0039BE474D